MKTILQTEKECYFCKTPLDLHDHHIFFGANRKQSEKYGMKVWLCATHHNMSSRSVHHNRDMDLILKQIAQEHWEKNIGTREEFREVFGRSYL